MTQHPQKTEKQASQQVRPLRWWWVLLIAFAILIATGYAMLWLMNLANQSPLDRAPAARIEAVRTALTLGAGLVGMVVLVLTGRKQWLAEHSQRHTEADAREQRATEIYTAAAEQLASDNASVRMAGLYALDRVAQGNRDHRQTVTDLFCAYLRMPFTPPAFSGETDSLSLQPEGKAEHDQQELQVRLTAQRLIESHTSPYPYPDSGPPRDFWEGMYLDLTGAALVNLDMRNCEFGNATFDGAKFYGDTAFTASKCTNIASFDGATFFGGSSFLGADFKHASFAESTFKRTAVFSLAKFDSAAHFGGSNFHEYANFNRAKFRNAALFSNAKFFSDAHFSGSQFGDPDGNPTLMTTFYGAEFHKEYRFSGAHFFNEADLEGVKFFQGDPPIIQ